MPLLRQVCAGVHTAHQHSIVHRDLKPQNIFVCRYHDLPAFAKVLDFGISKMLDATAEFTGDNTVLGTPHFMAPEQASGRSRRVDRRTDVYALGAIAYLALGGRPPFEGDTPLAVLFHVTRGDHPPLERLAPHLPAALCRAVSRAMAHAPDDRFATVAAFSEALSAAVEASAAPAATGPRGGTRTPPGGVLPAAWSGRWVLGPAATTCRTRWSPRLTWVRSPARTGERRRSGGSGWRLAGFPRGRPAGRGRATARPGWCPEAGSMRKASGCAWRSALASGCSSAKRGR